MYANLRVTTTQGKDVSAWRVDVERDRVVVYLDANDTGGRDPEPGGELVMRPGDGFIRIMADF